MTKIATGTYQATVPRYESGTWVRYRIIAYDNNENHAISDHYGYYHTQTYMHVTRLNRSIVFLVGAFIIIISGVFLLMVKVSMHK